MCLACTILFNCYDVCFVVGQHCGHRWQSVCVTPRRGGLSFGTGNRRITSRRVCCSKIIVERFQRWQRGRRSRTNSFGAPAVARLAKRGDPQVFLPSMVPIPYRKQIRSRQGGDTLDVQTKKHCSRFFMARNTARGV